MCFYTDYSRKWETRGLKEGFPEKKKKKDMALEKKKRPGKKAVKIPAGEKISGVRGNVWKQLPGGAQGPWSVMPEASSHEQWHTKIQHDFGSSIPGPAVPSLPGREAKTY